MPGFSACTISAPSTYNVYTGDTPTVHPVMTDVVYDESLSGFTTVDKIQCGMVLLGGNGLFC